MKKRFFVLFIISLISFNSFSQAVTFVEDITAIATAIENGLTMYQQLMNNIQQLQKTAEEVENIKKQMEGFDLSNYDWTKWDSFLHAANDFMNLQDDLQNAINAKNMKIGNYNFSLKDLYTTDFFLNAMSETERNLNPNNITEEQRNAFIGRHGMTPEHYNKYISLEKEIATKSQEVVVIAEQARKTTKKLNEQMQDIGVETDSDKQAQDKNLQYQNGELQTAIVQTEIQISMLESLQNIGQHILEEHKLTQENFEASTYALENFKSSHNSGDAGDDNDYLHLWGSKNGSPKIKVTK